MLGSKEFWVQHFLGIQELLALKKFGFEINFGQKKLGVGKEWVQKVVWTI